MRFFFFFLCFLPFLLGSGFGVSPTHLDSETETIYVINQERETLTFMIDAPRDVLVYPSNITLLSGKRGEFFVELKDVYEGTLKISISNQSISPSVLIPITRESVSLNTSSNTGIILVILFNLVGLILLGVLRWKKKLFFS